MAQPKIREERTKIYLHGQKREKKLDKMLTGKSG